MNSEFIASVSPTNRDIVLYILGELGGKTAKIDVESLAIECFERYPSKFGLVKFPKYPDVESVRVALADSKKPKYGSLVKGNKANGWMLSREGGKWYEENKDRIETGIEKRHPLERRLPQGRNLSREKISKTVTIRLLESNAYRKWKTRNEITIYDFFDAMRVDQYLPEVKYQEILRNTLQAVRDNGELMAFVEHLHSLYGTRYRTFFVEVLKRESEADRQVKG